MTSDQKLTSNQMIKELYNGTIHSVKTVIPNEHKIGNPKVTVAPIDIQFGVLIGFTGDLEGKLILHAQPNVISLIGQAMFGMPITNDILNSFTGELGNMLAGSLSTSLSSNGIYTDITHPTVLNGNANLRGFNQGLLVTVTYPSMGDMDIHLLVN
ncbi:chemotaxis protein CheX [Aquibacillus rhizosphaerae]|uniref:Chemotaxis protein CheX n=1 Tax=Aquibacillus rhizosphaerae TaxID=3051431 RepID=A0ABT7L0J1_9BACI|nr:chemotaxis protein CheX [Aquibacillus sp. LR5S19]MDL4839349.1 chemotaxis protein CheX [Aquibacillus sp. LR5S19]